MAHLKRWAIGPYELLRHADQHRHDGGDFDRRMALFSFDNAIVLAIRTYLTLPPSQRADGRLPVAVVSWWLKN